jgi:DNA helicase HerA-like ATPase
MIEQQVGHTLVIGSTGAGKTLTLNLLLASLDDKTRTAVSGNRAMRRGHKSMDVSSRAKAIGKRSPGARP